MNNYIGPKNLNYKKQVEKALKKKSVSTLKVELQKVFNTYIRLRDTEYDKGKAFFVCVSCDTPKDLDQMHAGHFWSVGGNEAVRFDEDNCHAQCIRCNMHLHGNLLEYRVKLIRKIGQQRFDTLEIRRHNRSKMMAFEIEVLIDDYKSKIERLKSNPLK